MNIAHICGRTLQLELNGVEVACDPAGILVVPSERTLVVSDLHLEKGAAFARRGMFLPPYDTAMTLATLSQAIERHTPDRVICLGDSFHDRRGADLMPAPLREHLSLMMTGREWIWISGNHDPERPSLGGEWTECFTMGALSFRHEPRPDAPAGEIAGHLHPAARVASRGRSVRGPCFATDRRRMIMPAFGVTTGGLNVLHRAFDGLFTGERPMAGVIGRDKVYPIPFSALV
ncbi:ligase-associated DNA damage response endonuclease PdeM [Consotaella salsifontis]|uniref:Putative phosphoesterase n=1 Tax=Consotaella salsifontis TaxID=1365950 RepID=A0A1T4T3S1_9HYPH|nr:ligase-associated DNA damage response endonuclease PdeM [Consotaella salsifontis]SKA34891.1 putative phosphoesterase [Consotaella salsifontis]